MFDVFLLQLCESQVLLHNDKFLNMMHVILKHWEKEMNPEPIDYY